MTRNSLRTALGRVLPIFAAVVLLTGSAAAQDLTTADVTRLQQTVDQVGSDLVKLRARDRAAARAMQNELTDLEEEVTYLKVNKPKPLVLFEVAKGMVTGTPPKVGEERHLSRSELPQ